jgi:hypothetical protein
MHYFDIYFFGETLPDSELASVKAGVAELFKIDAAAVERLFSGKGVRVKQAVDAETASRYRAAFREVGALIQIVPTGSPAPDGTPNKRLDRPSHSTASTATAPQEPGMTLAEPGAILDHSPTAPAAQINTDGLEALPANSGSLEDCRQEKPPQPIPDISHMRLVDD